MKVTFFVLCAIGAVIGHHQARGLEQLDQNSTARLLQQGFLKEKERNKCKEMFIWGSLTRARGLNEYDEDMTLDSLVICKEKFAGVCLIGPQAVLTAGLKNEIEFLFTTPQFNSCVVLYEEASSGDIHYNIISCVNTTENMHIVQENEQYYVIGCLPFFSFLYLITPTINPRVYRYKQCLLDDEKYPFIPTSQGIFGRRSHISNQALIKPPGIQNLCHPTANEEAFERYTTIVQERVEYDIMQELAVCLDGKKETCTVGVSGTVSAFMQQKLSTLIVTNKSHIMAVEYLNAVTGKPYVQFEPFNPNLRIDALVKDGDLYYFKSCRPFLEYAAQQNFTTLIIRNTRESRNLDDETFKLFYKGIAGLLAEPRGQEIGIPYSRLLSGITPYPNSYNYHPRNSTSLDWSLVKKVVNQVLDVVITQEHSPMKNCSPNFHNSMMKVEFCVIFGFFLVLFV